MEQLGRPIYANTIMMGALTRAAGFLEKENMLATIHAIIPKFKDENRQAFELGFELAAQ